ncbi:MAG TPA: hypothetical protein DEF00_04580 [Candidatus Taylorbacteria bacterium]|nr:MAG: hypothetical protein UY03_C0018G0018 [Parcubacteria group bacterium GW2011_GWA2_47_64]KKU97177.1 MAG: hypothetical protein UY29_C0002G0074 [Parcubacteria group bacterium GW2011_GWC2_48_17]HBV01626.1 hypothetical protein [Candidatus Taylorbacteria bacterium]
MTHIILDTKIRHGKPTIEGTRITVEEVLGALTGGMNYEEIEQEYGIDREGILAAVRYAAAWIQGEEVNTLADARK